jgi:hypothetical protein
LELAFGIKAPTRFSCFVGGLWVFIFVKADFCFGFLFRLHLNAFTKASSPIIFSSQKTGA